MARGRHVKILTATRIDDMHVETLLACGHKKVQVWDVRWRGTQPAYACCAECGPRSVWARWKSWPVSAMD